MANIRITMLKLKRMLQLLAVKMPQREICSTLQMGRSVLSEYKKRADSTGSTYLDLSRLDDSELESLLHPKTDVIPADPRKIELDELLPTLLSELKRKYVTIQLLWEEYIREHPEGYQYKRNHEYAYHNTYSPGMEMQIDFAGDVLYVTDQKTGTHKSVVVLCCLLPFSGVGFAMALSNATMEHFFYGLSKAFEYIGGVPSISKSDNMKQWVKRTDRYEPSFTDAAMEWSLYYETELDAARPGKPRDKGPVESIVNKFYLYVYARLRNEVFYSLSELNNRISLLTDEYNHNEMKKRGYSRMELFEAEERSALKPLPVTSFRFKYRKAFKINSTYHVTAGKEQHFYSVPYQYVGKDAIVNWDYDTVEIYVENSRIASHSRSFTNGYTTEDSHMPPNHQAYKRSKEFNAAYYQTKALYIGFYTKNAVDKILSSKLFVQQSYKSCQGILSLTRKFGEVRVEAACKRVADSPVVNYGMIKNILEKNLDMEQSNDLIREVPKNEFVRGSQAYN